MTSRLVTYEAVTTRGTSRLTSYYGAATTRSGRREGKQEQEEGEGRSGKDGETDEEGSSGKTMEREDEKRRVVRMRMRMKEEDERVEEGERDG